MKLTNEMRSQFMDAVEKALPPVLKFDREGFEARYVALMEVTVPQEIKDLEKKYPGSVMRDRDSLSLSNGVVCRYSGRRKLELERHYLSGNPIRYKCTFKSEDLATLNEEAKAAFAKVLAAEEERYQLLKRMEQIVKACSTDAALRELMPELADLIPKPPEKAFPIVATQVNNVIADLVKAGLTLKEAA